MLTSLGVGFYSLYDCMVFADTSESVGRSFSPRFFIVSTQTFGLTNNININ